MPHSNFAALGRVIAEQQAVLLPECHPLRDRALHEADYASLVRDLAMKVRCSVVVVGGQLDWMMTDTSSSMRQGVIAALWARKLVVQSLEEADLGEHRSCQVSKTVETYDAGNCTGEDYVEGGTGRDDS